VQYILVFYCWSRSSFIAWILVNIVQSSISYCASVRVQYDTLRGTIFTNIHAITQCSWKCFLCFPEIKQNSYCTSANIKIFFLVQYSNDIWKNHILTVLITLLKKKYLLLYNKRVIAYPLHPFLHLVIQAPSWCRFSFN
jgi:hypothetical protein